jgi:hypothetical protein
MALGWEALKSADSNQATNLKINNQKIGAVAFPQNQMLNQDLSHSVVL